MLFAPGGVIALWAALCVMALWPLGVVLRLWRHGVMGALEEREADGVMVLWRYGNFVVVANMHKFPTCDRAGPSHNLTPRSRLNRLIFMNSDSNSVILNYS